MQKVMELLEGKKRYILILCLAGYDLLKAFEVIQTTAKQDVSVYVFLLALVGLEVSSKAQLIKRLVKKK